MKKLSILMNVLAFVFAIGAAYASANSGLIQGYKFVGVGKECEPSLECNNEGEEICMEGSDELGDSVDPQGTTKCGTILRHRP